jgi:hypothetical protein
LEPSRDHAEAGLLALKPLMECRLPFEMPASRLAAVFYVLSAVKLLARLKPDVIHAHEILSPASAAVLARSLYGQPVLVKILRGGILGDIYKIKNRLFGIQRFRFLSRRVDSFVVSDEMDRELSAMAAPRNAPSS